MIEHVIISLSTTLTVLQTFEKWGWIDYYSARFGHIKWLPSGGCFLCLAFWLSIIVASGYQAAKMCHVEWLFIPFACAGIVNYLTVQMKK